MGRNDDAFDDAFGPWDRPPRPVGSGRDRPERSWGAVSAGLLVVAGLFGYLYWTTGGELVDRVRTVFGYQAPMAEGEYVLLGTQADSEAPVAWPCGPIEYEVNTSGAPPNWKWLLTSAADAIAEAGGPSLEFTGTTEDRDFEARQESWTREPVLVGWAPEADQTALAGDVVGYAGPAGITSGGRSKYLSGAVVLEKEFFARAPRVESRAVVMHEFAHVVGLGHVDNPTELMNEENIGTLEFGPGDRAGLRTLGELRCG